jgi:hypothetical protein
MSLSSCWPSGPVARVLRAAAALSSAATAQGGKQVAATAGSPELEQARALLSRYQVSATEGVIGAELVAG